MFLIALVTLLVNDFVLKRLAAGPVTGKLSDFVGPIVASLLCVALAEVATRVVHATMWARPWWFAFAAGAMITALGLVKLTSLGAHLYVDFTNWVITLVEPAAAAVGWNFSGSGASVVMDPWDVLVAILSAPLIVWVGVRWRGGRTETRYLSETVTPPLKSES